MHLLEDFPQAVIVDDLSSYVDSRCMSGNMLDLVQHSKHLLDIAAFPCRTQGGTDKRQREALLAKLLAVLHDATGCAT